MHAQTLVASLLFIAVLTPPLAAAQAGPRPLPAGARLFILPMDGDFHVYLKDAIVKRKVPVTIVEHMMVHAWASSPIASARPRRSAGSRVGRD